MMKQSYDTLILGADFTALGYALAHSDCLIIEASEIIGKDFVGCFRPPEPFKLLCNTQEGKMFADFLAKTGVLRDNGFFDLPSLSPVTYSFVKENSLPVLLQAHLADIRIEDGKYMAEIYTNSGMRTFYSSKLLDTTASRISLPDTVKTTAKYLNLLCHNPCDDFLECLQREYRPCTSLAGFHNGEWIVHFEFDVHTSLSEARKIINTAWQKAFKNGEAMIDGIGYDFEITTEPVFRDDANRYSSWLHGGNFSNPVEALDAGAGYEIKQGEVCL